MIQFPQRATFTYPFTVTSKNAAQSKTQYDSVAKCLLKVHEECGRTETTANKPIDSI